MRVAAITACAVFAVGCGGSPTQPSPPPDAALRLLRTRYLAFGDSITAGTTSPPLALQVLGAGLAQSYPSQLQDLLARRYARQTISVENAGLPGEAAEDAVLRFPMVIRATNPEVVILLHGVNDVTFLGPGGVSRVAGFLRTMIRQAREVTPDVMLCTLPPQREGALRAGNPNVIAAYNVALRELARAEAVILVDFARDFDLALIGADGLHPTEAGYRGMAQMLFEAIRDRFEARTVES